MGKHLAQLGAKIWVKMENVRKSTKAFGFCEEMVCELVFLHSQTKSQDGKFQASRIASVTWYYCFSTAE
jgi:hypothetical protein